MKLEGRVALVTGGSRGIGRGICLALADEGAAVGVNYRSGKAQAEEVVEEIKAKSGQAVAVPGDVSEWEEAEAAVAQTVRELGNLHILVNNAGVSQDALIMNMDPGDWLKVMKVNFGGTFNRTKPAFNHFPVDRRPGSL